MSTRNGKRFLLAVVLGLTATQTFPSARRAAESQVPIFQVDPLWPKPLPNHWTLGAVAGVAVDNQDHIWIVHRQSTIARNERFAETKPPQASCCIAAPPVLEFDPSGKILRHWGGPGQGYDWPETEHSISFDPKGNVWISGSGAKDDQILKFTVDGKFLLQIGKKGQSKGNSDTANLGGPTSMAFDASTNEVFVADGYHNKRVIVFDYETGQYKRHWGGSGDKPEDNDKSTYVPGKPLPRQFGAQAHCAALANDGLLYVCDKYINRVQVFKRDGTFVSETLTMPNTFGESGAAWDIAFSPDREQRFLYLADGKDSLIHVFVRKTMEHVSQFGDGGRGMPGRFFGVHNIATDSKGNLYTVEVYEGHRIQKFLYKGMGPASSQVP